MASMAFQKFKALENNNTKPLNDKEPAQHGRGSLSSVSSSSSKYSPQTQEPPPPKKQKRRNLIGDIADRFESEEKKKQEEAQRKEFMRLEIERQEKAEVERKQLEQERLEKQLAKLEEERMELERKQKEEESNRRKEERRRKLEEEDQQFANMKPAQALFARRIANKNGHDVNNKENRNVDGVSSNNRRIKDMKAKFFHQVENKEISESTPSNDASKEKTTDLSTSDIGKKEDALPRKQSGTDMFCDLYTKGNCNSIKSIFEQNIAVKKGFIPDPNLTTNKDSQVQQTDLLKVMPNKVKTNASQLAKQFNQNKSDKGELLRSKEYIPINKKTFNHFLDKFEDDRSRQAAKAQLQQLTLQQKEYLSQEAPSWLKKQEEKEKKEFEKIQKLKRDEEERIMLEEQKQRLEYERQKRLEQEEEEKRKHREIQELQERIEKEKKELLAAKKAAIKAKKEAKRKSKLGSSPPTELPKIVSNTYNDLKTRFDVKKGTKSSQISDKEEGPIKRGPVVRKLVDNPFEQSLEKNEVASVVKRREVPVLKQNRIGDIKKRYTMFMTGGNSPERESLSTANNSNTETCVDNSSGSRNDVGTIELPAFEMEKANEKPQKNILSPDSFLKTKTFLRLSAEKLTNSKEKLFKGSKDKITEGNEEIRSTMTRKPSKNDMQNYLISKVLFDDKKPVAVVKQSDIIESPSENISDAEDVALDDEYIKEMEKYLMFIDEEYSTSKKKKKKKAKKKQEPKIQIVQVNHIKQQFETKKVVNNNIEKNTSLSVANNDNTDSTVVTNERGIGKLRQRFQLGSFNEPKIEGDNERKPKQKRVSRMINQDLLKKFDSPELAEELKNQREKEREERKRQRIAKLEEEKKLMEERKQEALRIEQERLRQEEERLEALRLEQLRIEEEQRLEKQRQAEEARLAAAYEETVLLEKEKAAKRELKNLAIKSLREKNEPALKKKKVLGRIQHMFEKNVPDSKDEEDKLGRIGSLKGKAEGLFSNDGNNNSTKKSFQDPSLAGVGISLDKFKGKFEATSSEEPIVLSKGVTIKKKEIPSALIFEQKLKEQSKADNNSPVRQNSTDWSWKKKDPKELAVQSAIAIHGESKEDQRKTRASEREQRRNDRQRELLDDIHQMNNRLMKKDAIKEHEQKMKEYGEFMSEIQNYLNEPDKSASESTFKDDIQNYINVVGSSIASNRSRHKSNEKKPTTRKSKIDIPSNHNQPKMKIGIQDIKNKLSESGNTFVRKEVEEEPTSGAGNKNNVKSMKQKLVDQYFSQMNTSNDDNGTQKFESVGMAGESISKAKDLFETRSREEEMSPEQNSTFKKKSVNVPSIFTQHSQNETEEDTSIRKSSYEWKYKKKSIQDFQKFIDENKDLVPPEVSQGCANIASKLNQDERMEENKNEIRSMDKNEVRHIEEYDSLMKAVDTYLEAPDKSTKEIDFKSEVERYLDLIEEPEPKCDNNSPAKTESIVVRRPKKLDITQYEQNASRPQSQYENSFSQFDDTDSNKKPNSKSIKNLQNKLLAETGKSMAKEELQLHIAGADQMKKAYEKLNKPKDNTLLSAPKAILQKTFAQLKDEIVPEKTLEILKSEHQNTEWKWKQKSMKDLNTSIKMFKDHGINTPAKIEEQHKKLVQTNEYLHTKQSVATSLKDAEEIKRLQDLRDQEVENFLQEMKSYIEKPSATNKESSLKSGITDYLDLIEDETNNVVMQKQEIKKCKEEGGKKKDLALINQIRSNKKLPKIGQVSNIKQILEKDINDTKRDSSEGGENVQEKWKRGKVDTSFFNKDGSSDKNNKVVDPVILSSINSSKIKEQLEAQYAKDEGKSLTSAPKRKFKTFEPQQVLETSNTSSTKAYLEVRAVECDYKKYKKLYTEQEPTPKEEKPKITSAYSNITDENERKAAILAKYGCKPRPQRRDSESSSSSTSSDEYDAEEDVENNKVDENNIPLHIVQSNAMYAIYGDRLGDNAPKKTQKKKKDEPGDAILQMLRAMRQGAQSQNPHSGGPRKPRQDSVDSSDNDFAADIIPGSCKDIKSKFEERPTNRLGQVAPPPPQRSFSQANKRSVEKSTSCSNVRSMFESQTPHVEDDGPTKGAFRAAPLNKRVFEAFVADDDSPQSSPNQSGSNLFNRKGGIAKSSSFNKFKDAFESGKVYLNDDEEYTSSDNDVVKTTSFSDARMEREAELDELRSCPRLKRMFNINKPANRPSPLAKSSSSSAVSENLGLDDKTMSGVSQARSQIRNMFESSAPKVTFGQKLSEQVGEPSKQSKPPVKKPSNSNTEERKWVFDAINKYFDVIVEDDKEEEEEDDDEMDDEFDDSDEEDEGSPIFSSEVRCTSSRFAYQTQPMTQDKSQYNIVRAEPVNIREVDDGEDEEVEIDDSDEDNEDEGLQFEVDSEDDDDGLYDNTEQEFSQRGFQLQKSTSSSKIRGHFHSVLMRSASGTIDGNANLSNFKANLRQHLQRRGSATMSTGGGAMQSLGGSRAYLVDEPSDDDVDGFSSDDDLEYDDAEEAIIEST